MATLTASYSFQLPTVGGDVNVWGGYVNSNFEDIDDLFDGTTPVDGIDIDGGSIDGVIIGASSAAAGTFTTLTATAGTLDGVAIGGTTPAAGDFTSITATLTAAITGNTTIGGTLDVTGASTFNGALTVSGSGAVNLGSGNLSAGDATFSALDVGALSYPAQDGSAGQFLQTSGAGSLQFATINTNGVEAEYEEFTSSGIWTKPPDVTWVYVEVWGAGGGGAHSDTVNGAGGGGGGEYNCALFLATSLSSTESVTIGSGGSGGADTGENDGADGGNSQFASLQAFGGRGGTANAGSGGVGGSSGRQLVQPDSTTFVAPGSYAGGAGGAGNQSGGNSTKGGAGGGGWGKSGGTTGLLSVDGNGGFGNGTAGNAPGGGGGASNLASAGGDGADGRVRIWAW